MLLKNYNNKPWRKLPGKKSIGLSEINLIIKLLQRKKIK